MQAFYVPVDLSTGGQVEGPRPRRCTRAQPPRFLCCLEMSVGIQDVLRQKKSGGRRDPPQAGYPVNLIEGSRSPPSSHDQQDRRHGGRRILLDVGMVVYGEAIPDQPSRIP
jgi:hypothetical protein